jgi:hypothetical protein
MARAINQMNLSRSWNDYVRKTLKLLNMPMTGGRNARIEENGNQ